MNSILVDSFFFFFFQAEDGIRDYKVTGVQTCALPILRDGWIRRAGRIIRIGDGRGTTQVPVGVAGSDHVDGARPVLRDSRRAPAGNLRSEERRVGKECRSGGTEDD